MSLLKELRRRSVFRTAIAYLAAVWLVLQVVDTVLPYLDMPGWIMPALIYAGVIAFPLVLLISWKYELTPDGFRPTEEVTGEPVKRYRHFDLIVYSMMTVAIVVLIVDNYVLDGPSSDAEQSVAVLPLVSLSQEPDDVAFTGGMHDEILSRLASISALKVISRTSVLPYRDSPKNIREIAAELGVANILEGSVRRAANTIRIDIKLIDARSDEQLWANIYDRTISAGTILAIQSEVARAVADSLQAELTSTESDRLDAVPTEDTDAYEFYLSGLDYMSDLTDRESARAAASQFELAVEADPSFALAWLGVADAHMWLSVIGLGPDYFRSAQEALARAEELQPGIPELEITKGHMAIYAGDHDAAIAHLTKAEQSLSGSAALHATKGRAYQFIRDLDNAIASFERAIELSPRDSLLRARTANTYANIRQYDMAEYHASKLIDFNPGCHECRVDLADIRMMRGDEAASIRSALTIDTVDDQDFVESFRAYASRFYVAWRDKQYDHANAILDDWAQDSASAPTPILLRLFRARVRALQQGTEASTLEFRQILEEIEPRLEQDSVDLEVLRLAGESHAFLGNETEAVRIANRLIEADAPGPFWYDVTNLLPALFEVLLVAKQTDRFLKELDEYLSGPGSWSIEALERDPRLDYLRDDPQWIALVEKHRRPQDAGF